MKAILLLFVTLACLSIFLLPGCNDQPNLGYKVIDTQIALAQWSPDGQYLFYTKGPNNVLFRRYDTITGKITKHDFNMEVYKFSSSPDNTRIAFVHEETGPMISGFLETVRIVQLDTRKMTIISNSGNYTGQIAWLRPDKLLVSLYQGECEIIDTQGHKLGNIQKQEGPYEFLASDASKLIYEDQNEKTHVFRFADRSDKIISPVRPTIYPDSSTKADMRILSANGDIIVYRVYSQTSPNAYVMNVNTQKCVPLRLPFAGPDMGMSPDFTKYWFMIPDDQCDLCIADTPPETLKMIRSLQQTSPKLHK